MKRMDIKEVRSNAKERMKSFCNLCRECDGVWCAGQVPGMGGTGTGNTFKRNYEKLKELKVIMRTLHEVKEPDLTVQLFGEKLSFPGIIAPITGTKFNMGGFVTDEEYSKDIFEGGERSETLTMIGDTGDANCFHQGLEAMKNSKGKGIAIIKPRENDEIINRIKMAEEAGAIGVGIDVDGAGLVTMKLFGQPVGPKTEKDLKVLVNSTKLPFIVKGILTEEEVEICIRAGVAAVVISNHGGRCLNDTISAIEVLENIAEKYRDKITILADGGIREGVDILKFLALGAHGVLIGRPIIWGSIGGRGEGVHLILEMLKSQLYQSMILTGTKNLREVSKKILFR